jgi:ribosomal protein L2
MVQVKVLQQTGMLIQRVCPHYNVLQLKKLNSNLKKTVNVICYATVGSIFNEFHN